MRTIFVATVCLAGLSSLAAIAQPAPSLAVAAAQAAPVVAKKYAPQAAPAAAAMPRENADTGTITGTWTGPRGKSKVSLDFARSDPQAGPAGQWGDWKGAMLWAHHRLQVVLHLAPLPNGSLSAKLDILGPYGGGVPEPGLSAEVVEYHSPRLHIKWPGTGSYEGVFMPGKTSSPSFAHGSPLEEVLHALDVQTADHLGAMRMFKVLEENDLKETITMPSGQSNQICNLNNPTIAEQYKNAGIDYLLVTTLEAFVENTLDQMEGKVDIATVNVDSSRQYKDQSVASGTRTHESFKNKGGVSSRTDVEIGGKREGSSSVKASGKATTAQLSTSVSKNQSVDLEVRCRLYHVADGTLLETVKYSFKTNRTYVVAAGSGNVKEAGDLYQLAAKSCAVLAANRIADVVFPIKVLEKSDGVITIKRGAGSALRVGQVFRIYSIGKEIRDPSTGEVLGHDETTVGKVWISEVNESFSKAKITEDNGISAGAILRGPVGTP